MLRQRAARTIAFSLAKQRSLGLRSGLYGGRYHRVASACWMARRTGMSSRWKTSGLSGSRRARRRAREPRPERLNRPNQA